MSSSKAHQCRPVLLSSLFKRWSGVAASSLRNQSNGMAVVRPSTRLTYMLSSSKRTDLGKVFIPCPFAQPRVLRHPLSQLVQTALRAAAVTDAAYTVSTRACCLSPLTSIFELRTGWPCARSRRPSRSNRRARTQLKNESPASSAPSQSPRATTSPCQPCHPWPPRCPETCGRWCSSKFV